MNPQPKRKRLSMSKYLKWLRDKPCAACGKEPWGDHLSVPAHQRFNGNAGTGIKPDDTFALPLCHECHMKQHSGRVLFLGSEDYVLMHELLTEYLRNE